MDRRKSTAIVLGVLIIGFLVFCFTQSVAQTTAEPKQALIGEWRGVWAGGWSRTSTLINHEIDTANAKARCTFSNSSLGEKKYPVSADFISGTDPKLEFKLEDIEYKFVLKKNILKGSYKGMMGGFYQSNTIEMEKYPKK